MRPAKCRFVSRKMNLELAFWVRKRFALSALPVNRSFSLQQFSLRIGPQRVAIRSQRFNIARNKAIRRGWDTPFTNTATGGDAHGTGNVLPPLHGLPGEQQKNWSGELEPIHPYGRCGHAEETSKTMSTIVTFSPVETTFEKRAGTMEVNKFTSQGTAVQFSWLPSEISRNLCSKKLNL